LISSIFQSLPSPRPIRILCCKRMRRGPCSSLVSSKKFLATCVASFSRMCLVTLLFADWAPVKGDNLITTLFTPPRCKILESLILVTLDNFELRNVPLVDSKSVAFQSPSSQESRRCVFDTRELSKAISHDWSRPTVYVRSGSRIADSEPHSTRSFTVRE